MAEDFIELGIEGVDKLVDKHFHKVPDKYIDPHTYSLRKGKKKRAEAGYWTQDGARDDDEDDEMTREDRRGQDRENPRGQQDDNYDDRPRDPYYSQEGSDLKPTEQLEASYPRSSYDQIPPPPSANSGYPESLKYTDRPYGHSASRRNQEPEGSYPRGYSGQEASFSSFTGAGYDDYRGPSEGRRGLVRRSSSHPGTSRRDDRDRDRDDRDDMDSERRRRRRSFSSERKSDKGGDSGKTEKVVLTLLGAAVGGLAISAVMGSMSDNSNKKEHGSSSHKSRNSHGNHGGRSGKGGGGRR